MLIRLYPQIALAAVCRKAGGAVRPWILARAITTDTHILQSALHDAMSENGCKDYNRRRWIKESIEAGFLIPHVYRKTKTQVYFITGVATVANLCHMPTMGKRAEMDAAHLFAPGWRKYVWAAYLATTEERPISQKTKHAITGMSPQVQHNYQREIGQAIFNYSDTGRPASHLGGMRDTFGRVYFERNGRVFQRLPDGRIVPNDIAKIAPRGRQQKHQRQLNGLSQNRQVHGSRLFHQDHAAINRSMKSINKTDKPNTRPDDLFELEHEKGRVNLWRRVYV